MGRTTYSKLRIVFATLAVALITVAPAASAPNTPVPLSPDGDTVAFLPVFEWNGSSGAEKYNFALAADPLFNAPVYSSIGTRNTRATPDKTLPNGTYWWRVQAVDSSGNVSPWSAPLSVEKLWADTPSLTTPADGATVSFPDEPLVLRWDPVPGAAKYSVSIATDPDLSALVTKNAEPVVIQATNLAPAQLLASNTYYWAITPIDAQGNPGERSEVRSFTWGWPSATVPVVQDLVEDDTELFDPEFSWDPVPGAAHYEVEINSSSDFATGSKVCCANDLPITTTFAPKEVFPNNTYYWRVRAVNARGDAGVWNEGDSFAKTFDNYPLLDELGIKNLRMRDTADPGTDIDSGTPGYQTQLPIVTWDPVPGAASYQVNVVPFDGLTGCAWGGPTSTQWLVPTASTSWTPMAPRTSTKPFPTTFGVSKDTPALAPGNTYCVQVRARSGRVSLNGAVWGDFTQLDDGTGAAFTFDSFPTGGACAPSCNANYLGHDDYRLPIRGETTPDNPLFIWNPIAGKQSYWVIVAKDPSFTTIVDYVLTRIPAYAVRTGSQPRTYADETTSYYWVVLPATGDKGEGAPGVPSQGAYADFQKRSTPPVPIAPSNGSSFPLPPTFAWETTTGARSYHLQVASEPTFATRLDDVTTASTEYTAQKSYAAAKTLYWRVQALDENNTGLSWSAARTFEVNYPAPTLDPTTPSQGDASLPILRWFAVPGAVSYSLQIQNPNGTTSTYTGYPSMAASFEKITGTGIFTWKIRADFPKGTSGTTPGPWSTGAPYAHTIKDPLHPASDAGLNRLVLSWDAKTGTKQYKVQVSKRQDFAPYIDSKTTDNPHYAPTLTSSSYTSGGVFYWHVAAVDGDGNTGDWTPTRTFTLPPISSTSGSTTKHFKLSSTGKLVKKRFRTVYIKAKDLATLNAVSGASVRAYGSGVPITTKSTNSNGVAKFRLKPTQLGKVTFVVSRSGYATAYLYKKVYRP